MGLMSAAAVKPLVIALAIASSALLISNGSWWAYAATVKARSAQSRADLQSMATEREAWKRRAGELLAANAVYDTEFARLVDELKAAQAEGRRLQKEHATALASAEAAEADANRTLRGFMDRYAEQIRAPDCATAMAAVQRFCPALEGY